jgi:phage-related protein
MEPIKAWFQQNMPLIRQTVQTVLSTVTQFWRDHGQQIMAILGPLWEAIKALIGGAIKVILGLFKLVMQVINGDWKGAWETLKSVVVTAVAAVVDTVKNLASAIGNALKALLGIFGDLLKRFGAAGESLGTAIGQGIVSGIKNMASAIWETIKSVVASVIDVAKGALGIQSPSKVFAEMGDYSMQGYAQGVMSAGGRARDSVRETMKNVVRFSVPDISGMLTSIQGGVFEKDLTTGITRRIDNYNPSMPSGRSGGSRMVTNNNQNQSVTVHLGGITVNGSGNGDMNYGMQQAAQNAFERVFAGGMRNR